VSSSAAWLDIYSARSGSGSGTVYVYVAPDYGAAREGTINVLVPLGCINFTRNCNVDEIVFRSTVTQY
jgi:hypothetical protein